jgi:hypothetical protein
LNRQDRDYKWFEVYYLDEETLSFVKKEDIELYVDKKQLAEGCFHSVNCSKQSRRIEKIEVPGMPT